MQLAYLLKLAHQQYTFLTRNPIGFTLNSYLSKFDGKGGYHYLKFCDLIFKSKISERYQNGINVRFTSFNINRFVGEISEFIKIKSEDNEDEEEEFSNHFPIFIWAVRDFHLELTLDGQPISEDEYLENALKLNRMYHGFFFTSAEYLELLYCNHYRKYRIFFL